MGGSARFHWAFLRIPNTGGLPPDKNFIRWREVTFYRNSFIIVSFSFSHMIFTFCCCRDQEKIENWCNIQVWWQNSVTRLTWEIKFKFGGKLSFWESFEKIKRRSWKVGKLNLQQFLASTHTCVHIQCITHICVQTTYNGSELVVHLDYLIAQLDDLCIVSGYLLYWNIVQQCTKSMLK